MYYSKIEIANFKSIKKIKIDLPDLKKENGTQIIVGVNESGKSNLLNAIQQLDVKPEDLDYQRLRHKTAVSNEHIEFKIFLDLKSDNILEVLTNDLAEEISKDKDSNLIDFLAKDLLNCIEEIAVVKKYSDQKAFLFSSCKLKDSFPTHKYVHDYISLLHVKGGGISDQFFSLDINQLKEIIDRAMSKIAPDLFPNVVFWTPSKDYLITQPINLEKYQKNETVSVPLSNLLSLIGYNDSKQINQLCEKIRSNEDDEFKSEIQDSLSDKATDFVNSIWKEHNINIKVRIDGDLFKVHVEDKDVKNKYYNMLDRSEGFKHFISIILSMSTLGKSEVPLFILIDEPEIHLHPSAIRYLRDELIRIGADNYLFVTTHSPYMIDESNPGRHLVLSKEKMETKLSKVDSHDLRFEDEVLRKAFGLNLYKELLPANIIIVEGEDDKQIISKALKLFDPTFNFAIKAAGGVTKVYSTAALLADENIQSLILLDADKPGKNEKKKILNELKPYYNSENVKTLNDIIKDLPSDSTLEDLYSTEIIQEFFNEEGYENILIKNDECLIHQLKQQVKTLQKEKSLMASFKSRLSKCVASKLKSVDNIEKEFPKLNELCDGITQNMDKSQSKEGQ